MPLPSSAVIQLYASLARAPEYAMQLASLMTASAFERQDEVAVLRWARCHADLASVFHDPHV